MRLHVDREAFGDLAVLAAEYMNIPENAIRKDYYISLMLRKLAESEFSEMCVFKGGTSLSKCYPDSIRRFSEDIDLTFIPDNNMGNRQIDRALKRIENVMRAGLELEKIPRERNERNKSSYVWFHEEDKEETKVKLEIGSMVRPDPYGKREIKSYVQQYLEASNLDDVIIDYDLKTISINVLNIERTFLNKVMAVKRHAICGSLLKKVRHIYDVSVLMEMDEIKDFLNNKEDLKTLLQKTKETDSFYLKKRDISKDYDPTGKYDFPSWSKYFDNSIQNAYENLHESLLFTDEKQDFSKAIKAFDTINAVFAEIGE